MFNIVLFGAPGSGKGTQSAKLIDKFGLYHISTGDLLRDHIWAHTDQGKIAERYIQNGQLIPDDLMISILEKELREKGLDKKGVIFDGFPRTIPQAEALDELLKRLDAGEVNAVIGLEVPEDELVDRMLKRGRETGRIDDNLETIKKRIDVYHKQTEPLKHHYTGKGKYMGVNGAGGVDDIFNEIAKGVSEKMK